MQRMKSREEISTQFYLSQTDIRKLLQVGYSQAKRIYGFASDIDDQELNKWRIEPYKVRMTSVCKVIGTTVPALQKQIKSVPQLGGTERS